MVRTHQPGQAVFRSVLPEEIDWKPFPAFPPSVRLAVLVGQPSEPGPYVIRVKVPSGVKLMPHRHPEDRIYTVMSGVFYIGLGDRFDGDKVKAYPPGSVVVLPGDMSHFHWAKSGEYVTQVTAIGPLGLEYLILATIRVSKIANSRFGQLSPAQTDHRRHAVSRGPGSTCLLHEGVWLGPRLAGRTLEYLLPISCVCRCHCGYFTPRPWYIYVRIGSHRVLIFQQRSYIMAKKAKKKKAKKKK